jgi:hypothetical protein
MEQLASLQNRIKRSTFRAYNKQAIAKELRFKLTSSVRVLDQSNEYDVCIEKMFIPNSSRYRPIDLVENPYTIMIQYEDKDIPHPSLVYGPNYFQITGPLYSIQEFVDKVNVILDKASMTPGEYPLGQIKLTYQGSTIVLVWEAKETDYAKWNDYWVYFDYHLSTLFNFGYISGDDFAHQGEDFLRLRPIKVDKEQESFTADLFYKIAALRIYSNMPIGDHFVSNDDERGTSISNLVVEVYYNATQLMDTNSILYIPEAKVWSSLESYTPLNDVQLWCTWSYSSGSEIACMLDKRQLAQLTLLFQHK